MKGTVVRLTLYKLAAALLGLLYSVAQVRLFGATAQVDAFFVATSAVYMITSLAQGGQLAEVFLPEYLKLKVEKSPEMAHRLFSAVVNRLLFTVFLLCLAAFFTAPLLLKILGPGLAEESRELATSLFRLSLVLIAFTLFSSFVNTTLNAEGIFGRAELTGLVNSAISLLLLMAFHAQAGVWILVVALLSGKLVELASGIWFLRRAGLRFYPVWSVPEYNLARFFRVLFVTSGYVGATQLYTSIVTAAASFLPPGTLSVFNYVKLMVSKASGILIAPITTVFFSKFSNLAARQKEQLSRSLERPIAWILGLTLGITGLIYLSGYEVLAFLWKSKDMPEEMLQLAADMLVLGFVGLIFSGCGSVFRKAAVSLGASSRLYAAWIVTQLVSAAFSYLAIRYASDAGLMLVLPVNMALMALVSVLVSGRAGIETGMLLREALLVPRFLLLMLLSVFSLYLIRSYLPGDGLDYRLHAGLKVLAFGFSLMLILPVLYWKEIRRRGLNPKNYLS